MKHLTIIALVATMLFSCAHEEIVQTGGAEYTTIKLTYDKFVSVEESGMSRKSADDWKGHVLKDRIVKVNFNSTDASKAPSVKVNTWSHKLDSVSVMLRVGASYNVRLEYEGTPPQIDHTLFFTGEANNVLIDKETKEIMLECSSQYALILLDDTLVWRHPTLRDNDPRIFPSYTDNMFMESKDGFFYKYVKSGTTEYTVQFSGLTHEGAYRGLHEVFINNVKPETIYLITMGEGTGVRIGFDYPDLFDETVEISI